MEGIDQNDKENVIKEVIHEVEIQDEGSNFLRISLYEGECLSML